MMSSKMLNREHYLGHSLDVEVPKNSTDLEFILRKRLEGIDLQMEDFTLILHEFSVKVDKQL